MKREIYLTLVLGALLGAGVAITVGAHTIPAEKNAFTPAEIPYGPAPVFVAPGAQLAVLEGNPGATSGDYTIRLKMPAGYRIAPNWHCERGRFFRDTFSTVFRMFIWGTSFFEVTLINH